MQSLRKDDVSVTLKFVTISIVQEERSIPSAISVRQNDILSQLEKLRMVSDFKHSVIQMSMLAKMLKTLD